MNKKVSDFLFIFLLVAVIVFMAFVVLFLFKYKHELVTRPMQLGAEQLGGNVECYCTKTTKSGKVLKFSFTEDEWRGTIKVNTNYVPTSFKDLNLTRWEELNG